MKPFLKATVVSSLLCSVLSFGSIGHAVTIQTGWTNSSTRIGLDTYETDTSGAKINTRTDEGWLSLLRGRNISFIPDPENEYADTSNFLSAQKSDAGETNSLQSLDLSGTTWSNGQKIRLGFWLMNSSNSTSDENQATSVVSDIYYDDPGTITGVISASDLESGQPNPIYDQISTGIGNDKILVYEDAYIFNINTFGYDSINLSNDSNSKKLTINTGNLLGSPNYDYRISVDDHNFKYYLIDFVVQPDVTAPTGYSVAFNDDRINATEATSTSFSFSGAEVGASYSYSIDDSSTSTPAVTGSGQVSSANQTISNINVSSLNDGNLTLSFTLTDPAGNTGNNATSQAEKDTVAPTVSLSTDENQPNPTNADSFPVTITFDESVSGFTLDDISVSNGTASNFNGSGASYSATITPEPDKVVTISINANVATDAAGNGNTASNTLSITSDQTAPTVSITTDENQANPTNADSFPVTITFDESVSGFTLDDISVSNGTASNFNGSGASYSATITPEPDKVVTISINANVATDAAGNGNTASNTLSITSDQTAPTVSITTDENQANPTNADSFPVTITFDESVSGFVIGGINVTNGTASNFDGSGASYSATITPEPDKVVTISINANVATDAAGNNNIASTTNVSITSDKTAPAAPTVSGVSDGALVNSSVTPNFSCSEGTLSTSGLDNWANNSPISAEDTYSLSGNCTDAAGNVSGNTTVGFEIDTTPPANYSVAFDDLDDLINTAEQSSVSFTITNAEVGASYSYSISDGSNTVSNPQDVDLTITSASNLEFDSFTVTGIDLSSLSDGELTLTVSLTDPAGNTGADEINTVKKDTAAPTGSVSYSPELSTDTNGSVTVTVTCSDEQDGSGCVDPQQSGWTYDSSSNSISKSFDANTENTSDPESVTIKDNAGNTADISYSVSNIDKTAPADYSVAFDDDLINNTEAIAISFSFSGAEVGTAFSYSINDSDTTNDNTVSPVTGSGSITASDQQITGIDVSSLSDGDLTLTVSLTDPAGNVGADETNTALKDTAPPTDYSVAFDDLDGRINDAEATSISFSFSGAEVGTAFSYSINDSDTTNDNTVSPVTGSGSITASDQQITGVDVSSLSDGDLTLTVSLTDPAGNVGADETNTALKDTAPPTDYSVAFDDLDGRINSDEQSDVSFSFSGAEVGAAFSYFISDSNNTSTSTVTGSISASDQQISGVDVSSLSDGDLTLTVSLTDPAGNVGADVTDNLVKDTTAPTGYSVAFDDDDDLINDTEAIAISFSFANAEVGAAFSYFISDSNNTSTSTVTGSISASDQQISGVDVSSLSDGDLTLTVSLTDPAGNVGADVTDNLVKDTAAPTGYSVAFDDDDDLINGTEAIAISFSFSNAEVGATYSYFISDSNNTSTSTITGSIDASDQQITAIDVSSLSDGDLTLTVSLTDPAGNVGADVTDNLVKDTTAPTGYSVAFDDDDDLINGTEAIAISFSFSNAEVGAAYSYSINDNNSSNDNTVIPITGSGSITASNQQITTIDVSSLSDGDLTLTVSLTDPAGNTGADATNTVVKDTAAPTITGSVLATDNSYVDLTFSKPSYTNANATGALQVDDFKISNFSAENSDLISVTIDAITQTDNDDQTLATALTGGETVVRLWLNTNGTDEDRNTDDPATGGETLNVQVANGSSIYDDAGNPMDDDKKASLTLNDEIQPTITNGTVANTNEYIDVTFSEGVYGDEIPGNGREILIINDFSLTFTQNGGTATEAIISDISKSDKEETPLVEGESTDTDADADTRESLVGGETIVRLWLTITGDPTGVETIEVSPVADRLYDAAGLVMESSESTGTLSLRDKTAISFSSIGTLQPDNSYIDITLSEGAYGNSDGSGSLDVSDWEIRDFRTNEDAGGTATGISIASLANGENDSKLVGGETIIRFYFTIEGEASGGETFTLAPVVTNDGDTPEDDSDDQTEIFDADGNYMDPSASASNLASLTLNDITGPTVKRVYSESGNDGKTFKAGDAINIFAEFTENLVIDTTSGAPQLQLETENYATYNSTLTTDNVIAFEYTVQAGDNSDDLDYASTGALESNGAIITDATGNIANLTLAAKGEEGSLSDQNNIILDTTAPTVVSVDSIKVDGTSSTPDGTYGTGENLYLEITFSEIVEVPEGSAAPTLTLETGDNDTQAVYYSDSGTDALTFVYTVAAGDNSDDLNYVETDPLSGTITDVAGNDANLDLPDSNDSLAANANLVIDTTAPAVTSITSSSADGTYRQSGEIQVTINFDEAIALSVNEEGVDGLLITFDTGGTALISETVSIDNNASSLDATYTIKDGENSTNLQVSKIEISGNATLTDSANNAADLNIFSAENLLNRSIVVDTNAPTITNITSPLLADGSYTTGTVVDIEITFSEAVNLENGNLTVSLNTEPVQTLTIPASSLDGVSMVTQNYTVEAGDTAADLDVTAFSLSQEASLTAIDGTDVNLNVLPTGNNLADNKDIEIDTTAPIITISPEAGTYGAAQTDVTLICQDIDGSGCGAIHYTTDGSTADSSSPTFSAAFNINTTTNISYYAEDGAGNISQGTFGFIIDTDAPYAGVTYVLDGSTFDPETDQVKDGDQLEISAEFLEVLTGDLKLELTGLDSAVEVEMTPTSDPGSEYTGTYTVDGPDGSDTAVTLNFSGATDASGNSVATNANSGGSFTIDNSAPVAELTYELNGSAFDASTQTVSADQTLTIIATFDQPLEDGVSISLDGSEAELMSEGTDSDDIENNTFTYDYEVTGEDRTVTVTISDGADLAGNTVESTPTNNTFTVDSSPPTVTAITYDPTGPQADGTVVRISAEFSEAVSVPSIDISQTSELRSSSEDPVYKMEVDPNDATLYYFNYEIDSTKDETVPSQSGFSQIEIFDFYDLAGNTGTDYPTSDSDHLFIDNEAPLFSVDLEGGTYYSTEAISILPNCLNSTSGSSVSDIDKIYYTSAFDSSDSLVVATDPKTADEADVTELSAGTTIQVVTGRYENYQFYCTDAAGNESETHSHTYFVDPNGISASIDYDKGESPTYKQQDTVNFTVTFNAAVNPSDSPQLTLISDDTESADNGAVITLEVSNDDNTAENTKYTGSYTIAGDKNATIDVTVARTSGDEDTVPIAETPTKGGSFSVDNTVPTATAFNPANGATAVAESTNLEITFSEVVNLSDAGGSLDIYADGILSQEVELESEELISGLGSETLIINPTNDLPDGAEIYILIDSDALEDGAGNPFAGITDETTWSFSTTDTTAPTVSISPEGDNVSVGTEVTITFSEAIRNIDDSEITDANVSSLLTFKETDASGVDVAFSAEINSAKTIITLNPSSTLTESQTYYVAIAAVEDSAGNASTQTTATFTTSAECGNGGENTGEQCDDGNTVSGDGCSNSCEIEDGWLCTDFGSACTNGSDSGGSGNGGGSADPPAGNDIEVTWLDSITNYLMPTAMAQTASDPLEIPFNRSISIDFGNNIYFVYTGPLADLLITTSTSSAELAPIFTLERQSNGNPIDFVVTYEEDTANSYYALVVDPDESDSDWEEGQTYILTLQGGTIQNASLQQYSEMEYYLTTTTSTVTDGILETGEACDDGDDSVAGDGCTNGEVDEGYTCTNNPGVASTCSEVPEDSTSNNGSSTNSSSGGGGGISSLGAHVGICQSSRSGALSCADMYILETPYASSYRECLLETNDQGYTNSEDYCIEQWVAERGYQSCDDTDPSFLGKSGAAYQEALAAMCSGTQVEVTGISAENLSELTETLEANEEDLEDSIAELTACNQPQLYLRQTIARSLADEDFGASQLVLTVPSDELVRYEISAEYCIPANYQLGNLTIEEVTLLASGGYVYGKSAEPNWNQSLTEHQGTIRWYYTATADTLTGFDRGQIQTMVLGQLDYQEPTNCDAENGCQYISGSLGSLSNSSSLTNLMSLVGSQQAGATTLHVVKPFTESLAGAATNPAANTNFALLENLSAYDEKAVTSVELWGNSFRTTPDNSGVYFLDQGDLTLGGELDLKGQSRTIVIKSGSLNLTEDLTLKNGFAAFIVETGDLTVAADIERLEGLYILPVGEISAEKSSLPLTISGGLLADTTPLWMARKFIGLVDENGDVSLDQLQPAVSIYFDFRLLSETPPALESLPLSQWEQR